MQNRKLLLVIGSALMMGAPLASHAATGDSTNADSSSRSMWGWDDPSGNRPRSWIPFTSYGYVGLGAGRTETDLGNCAPGFSCDDKGVGFKVFTGGKFSRLLGLELGYVHMGKAQANGGDEKAQGVNLSLVANLPLGDVFNIYAKGGGIYGWTKTTADPTSGARTGKERGLNPSYGAGVQFDLTPTFALAADWDHYRFDYAHGRDDATMYSLNAIFKY